MEKVLDKLEQLESGEVGIIIYSQLKNEVLLSLKQGISSTTSFCGKSCNCFLHYKTS